MEITLEIKKIYRNSTTHRMTVKWYVLREVVKKIPSGSPSFKRVEKDLDLYRIKKGVETYCQNNLYSKKENRETHIIERRSTKIQRTLL